MAISSPVIEQMKTPVDSWWTGVDQCWYNTPVLVFIWLTTTNYLSNCRLGSCALTPVPTVTECRQTAYYLTPQNWRKTLKMSQLSLLDLCKPKLTTWEHILILYFGSELFGITLLLKDNTRKLFIFALHSSTVLGWGQSSPVTWCCWRTSMPEAGWRWLPVTGSLVSAVWPLCARCRLWWPGAGPDCVRLRGGECGPLAPTEPPDTGGAAAALRCCCPPRSSTWNTQTGAPHTRAF